MDGWMDKNEKNRWMVGWIKKNMDGWLDGWDRKKMDRMD